EIFRSLPLNQRIRIEQGTNLFEIMGCMDSASLSYNPSATYHTACQNSNETILGSMIDNLPSIYPTYFTNRLTFKINTAQKRLTFSLINMMGQKLFSANIQSYADGSYEIDTSTIPEGHYILELMDEQKVITRKRVIRAP
ncbi:MAG: T9SS type A sorting domain-containing protein, partial [Bacteroidota bacterium]